MVGGTRFPEARTASDCVGMRGEARGILCHTSCPWGKSGRCVGFGTEKEGGGKEGVPPCPLILLVSFLHLLYDAVH